MESWAGLRSLWQVLKRALTMLALGILGAATGGFTLGLLTFYVYGIGLALGLPLGFVVGAVAGARMAPRDVAIAFVAAAAVATGVGVYGIRTGQDSLLTTILALALAEPTALILLFALPQYVPARVRYGLAVPLSVLFAISAFGAWVWRIYSI